MDKFLIGTAAESRRFRSFRSICGWPAEGEKILGFRADGDYWRDLGTVASLQQAAEDMERKLFRAVRRQVLRT